MKCNFTHTQFKKVCKQGCVQRRGCFLMKPLLEDNKLLASALTMSDVLNHTHPQHMGAIW